MIEITLSETAEKVLGAEAERVGVTLAMYARELLELVAQNTVVCATDEKALAFASEKYAEGLKVGFRPYKWAPTDEVAT